MDIAFNVPVNPVSFGNVSFNLLKAAFAKQMNISFFPIGDIDLSTFEVSDDFKKWLTDAHDTSLTKHSRETRAVKLWHLVTADYHQNGQLKKLNPSIDSISEKQTFISFYELDSPTPVELNVARNFDSVFTSNYACEVFAEAGVKTRFVPLGFDKSAFKVTNKRYFADDRIVFCILGKFEQRKNHMKMIKAWIRRFGNDKRYYLQCAVWNPFFTPQINENQFNMAKDGKHYWNVNFLQYIPTNAMYNDFLNSNNIVLAMSGGEGWGLPEFHAVGLGKHAVIMNAHSYKDWANHENAVMVNPLNKVSAIDGVFFREGMPYNQGNMFSFDDEEFIAGCEAAIERFKSNPLNVAGLKIQDNFTYEKTLDALLK